MTDMWLIILFICNTSKGGLGTCPSAKNSFSYSYLKNKGQIIGWSPWSLSYEMTSPVWEVLDRHWILFPSYILIDSSLQNDGNKKGIDENPTCWAVLVSEVIRANTEIIFTYIVARTTVLARRARAVVHFHFLNWEPAAFGCTFRRWRACHSGDSIWTWRTRGTVR